MSEQTAQRVETRRGTRGGCSDVFHGEKSKILSPSERRRANYLHGGRDACHEALDTGSGEREEAVSLCLLDGAR